MGAGVAMAEGEEAASVLGTMCGMSTSPVTRDCGAMVDYVCCLLFAE